MIGRFVLLKYIGKAVLNFAGGGILGEVLFDVAEKVAEDWKKAREAQERRKEMEDLARAAGKEVRAEVAVIVQEIAGDWPPEVKKALTIYLEQVSGLLRASLRRPADPTGTSLQPGQRLDSAEDSMPILPPRWPRFQSGDRPDGLGDWVLEELLGVGGFGEVWKATNPLMPEPIAVKFCLAPQAAVQLRNEAALLAQVRREARNLPGVVELLDTNLSAAQPFLKYEYIDGGDLTGYIAASATRGQMAVSLAAKIIRHLANTLGHFHQLMPDAIVHRDMKPANILLKRNKGGAVTFKIADLGIGGLAARDELQRTRSGVSKNHYLATGLRGSHTPLYASPEQKRGALPDPRDDVHALGVIWYQLLTGDLMAGPPSGLDWPEELQERGMTLAQVKLLGSCFSRVDKRPVNAGVLASAIQQLFGTTDALPPGKAPPLVRTPPAQPHGTVVVAGAGDGDCRTLTEAVKHAPPNSRIVVKPGRYRGGIVLDKPLVIEGDGDRTAIVLEADDADCILMQTNEATVRGLTLRGQAGSKGGKYYAVDYAQGQLLLEECDIANDSLACVAIHGHLTNPTVRGCKIHDSKMSGGVFVYEQGQGVIENCDIYANKRAGVGIKQDGNPAVRNCKIHDSKESSGVLVYEQGQGVIENCDIFANKFAGVEIKQDGNLTVRGCKIHDTRESFGVLVWEKGRGVLEDCDIFANTFAGVGIRQDGNPTVRDCKIHDNKEGGVFVLEQGQGAIEDCDIFANKLTGVEIKEGSKATVRRCKINQNGYQAVYVHDAGAGTVADCDLTGNTRGAWDIQYGCQLQRRNNVE